MVVAVVTVLSALFQRCENLMLAFISSDLDDGNVTHPIDILFPLISCKVLPRSSITPLCDMLHSSQMIGRHCHNTSGKTDFFP